MSKSVFLATMIAMSIGSYSTAAHAVTCDVDIERAYSEAIKKGWTFKCMKGVLHFDNSKRPGCIVKPIIPVEEQARFFSNPSFLDTQKNGLMKNGWRIKSFQITGGQWTKKNWGKGATSSRVMFTYPTTIGSYHKRHLSKLVMEKNGGSCANLYNEAF